jgi:hypothetical protein
MIVKNKNDRASKLIDAWIVRECVDGMEKGGTKHVRLVLLARCPIRCAVLTMMLRREFQRRN